MATTAAFSVRLTTKERRRALKAARLETKRTGRFVSAGELIRRGGMPEVERVLAAHQVGGPFSGVES